MKKSELIGESRLGILLAAISGEPDLFENERKNLGEHTTLRRNKECTEWQAGRRGSAVV